MNASKKTVLVGISGGVDSSVSAALLKDQGFDVVGVFIRVWHPDFLECDWMSERRDAMRICAHLDIPYLEFDFEDTYKREVADYMIEEYKKGRTPNPDVMCNKHVKFGAFLERALSMGADYIATGHYAINKLGITLSSAKASSFAKASVDKSAGKNYELRMGKDKNKDQSYFLWTLTEDQLSKVLFPVGEFKKEHVRALAGKFGLSTEHKKDSQGVCFLGKLDMKEFLKHYIEEKPGDVVNEAGEVIGAHDGANFYTLGERHGFTITEKGTEDKPYYIVAKDIKRNTLTVSHSTLRTKGGMTEHDTAISVEKVNWISRIPELDTPYKARIRHLGKLHECTVTSLNKEKAAIKFKEPLLASPGQSLVLYDGEECIGGGVIV